MSRFAALYADKVIIENPLHPFVFQSKTDESTREAIADSLSIVLDVIPLFENALLSVRRHFALHCEDCSKKFNEIKRETQQRLNEVKRTLIDRYRPYINATLVKRKGSPYISLIGPELFIEHGRLDFVGKFPRRFLAEKSTNSKIEYSELIELGVLNSLIDPILEDLFALNVDSDLFHTNYFTNREIDFEITVLLEEGKNQKQARNFIEGFEHAIPAVLQVDIERLIKFRQKEGEAFQVYRDSIAKALKGSGNLSSDEIKELLLDEVIPQIHKIELAIKNSRSLLGRSFATGVMVASGFVGISLFTGILSPKASEIIGTLGGLKFAEATVEKVTQALSVPKEAMDNPYYFLWKLNKRKAKVI